MRYMRWRLEKSVGCKSEPPEQIAAPEVLFLYFQTFQNNFWDFVTLQYIIQLYIVKTQIVR